MSSKKIFTIDQLADYCSSIRKSKKIVFTNGVFDLLHVGHIRYLQEARALGDFLVVGVNSDTSVRTLGKGPDRPVQVEQDRAEILAALECVNAICIFNDNTPIKLIEAVKPNFLVKGGDWDISKIVGADSVIRNGGQVKSLPFVPGRSTSEIIKKINS